MDLRSLGSTAEVPGSVPPWVGTRRIDACGITLAERVLDGTPRFSVESPMVPARPARPNAPRPGQRAPQLPRAERPRHDTVLARGDDDVIPASAILDLEREAHALRPVAAAWCVPEVARSNATRRIGPFLVLGDPAHRAGAQISLDRLRVHRPSARSSSSRARWRRRGLRGRPSPTTRATDGGRRRPTAARRDAARCAREARRALIVETVRRGARLGVPTLPLELLRVVLPRTDDDRTIEALETELSAAAVALETSRSRRRSRRAATSGSSAKTTKTRW